MQYESIIGLEIHLQLKTKSKMFCRCANGGFDQAPNTFICPICLGHPGTLPMLNHQAVKFALRWAGALHCTVPAETKFDRKNYFYPDLPKGYQISQFDQPIAKDGQVVFFIDNERRSIRITRAHLEEDAAKLSHLTQDGQAAVDFNRAGAPLLETVTEPDFRSPAEARAFLQELRLTARVLGISDADMEKGQLRCDANISLRPVGDVELYSKTEIKNLNSFRSVEQALNHEISRQTKLWENGQKPESTTTRGWDEKSQVTVELREKEGSSDYRYFPEPDIPPLVITPEMMREAEAETPELPLATRVRLRESFALTDKEVEILVNDPALLHYYEQTISELAAWSQTKQLETDSEKALMRLAITWLLNKLTALVKEHAADLQHIKITPEDFAEFITLVAEERINSTAAQSVLAQMFATGEDPSSIIEEQSLGQIGTLEDLELIVKQVITAWPDQVAQYRAGKLAVLQFLLGKVMKETNGRANPDLAKKIIIESLRV